MRDESFIRMQWDDAQFCARCNKHFKVEGRAPYEKCPDCSGVLKGISVEDADRIERMMGLFAKTAGFLGMDQHVTETFQSMIVAKSGQIYRCEKCGELTGGAGPDGQAPQDGCRLCHGPLRQIKPDEVNAESLLKLPQSEVKEFTAKTLTEHSSFCPSCGKTTRDTQPPKFCSHCGANLTGRRASSGSGMWFYYLLLIAMTAGAVACFMYYAK